MKQKVVVRRKNQNSENEWKGGKTVTITLGSRSRNSFRVYGISDPL